MTNAINKQRWKLVIRNNKVLTQFKLKSKEIMNHERGLTFEISEGLNKTRISICQ
jgi:hypothetical protein